MQAVAAVAVAGSVYLLQRRRSLALAAGVVVLFEPAMALRVNGLSDIYFAAAVALSLLALIGARERRSWPWYLLSGVAAGLALGFRPPLGAVVLLPIVGLGAAALVGRRPREAAGHAVSLALSVLVVAPWLLANHRWFGSFVPPGYSRIRTVTGIQHETGLHDFAFYDPTAPAGEAGSTFDLGRWVSYLGDFAAGMLRSEALPLWLTAGTIAGVVAAARRDRPQDDAEATDRPVRFAAGLVGFYGLVGLGFAVLHHYEARYWTFLLPVAVLALFGLAPEARWWRPQIAPVLAGAVAIIGVLSLASDWNDVRLPPGEDVPGGLAADGYVPESYDRVAEVLPDDAVVLTPNPWQLAYHERINSIVLPYTGDLDVIEQVAERYDAGYVVIVDGDARHPDQRGWLADGMPPDFETVLRDGDTYVGRITSTDD